MYPPCLHIDNLSKRYKGASFDSLKNINLDIEQGEIFGIIGPNGAGKTTLISILCRIIEPTAGRFEYHIKDKLCNRDSVKSRIGFVPQELAFYEELTPMQNLRFFGAMYNLSKDKIKVQSEKLLYILGLEKVKDKRIKYFSGGMKRRVNLALGMLHQPDILFLDEPTVGVDVQSKRAILKFLKKENDEGTTIIYTSHHMKDAEEFCTSLALLDFGELLVAGPLPDLLKNEQAGSLEEFFIQKTGESYRDN